MKETPCDDFKTTYAALNRLGLRPVLEPMTETKVFHGTSLDHAKQIVETGFRISSGENESRNLYGEAVYVWCSDKSYRGDRVAHAWAEWKFGFRPMSLEKPAVVSAIVSCDHCFNPDAAANLEYFRAFFQLVLDFFNRQGDGRRAAFLDEHAAIRFLRADVPEVRRAQVIATRFRFKPLPDDDYPLIIEQPGLVIFDESCIVRPELCVNTEY